jgi:hypothetical protein
MTRLAQYIIPLCTIMAIGASSGVLSTTSGTAHASPPQTDEEKRDDDSYEVEVVRKTADGDYRALVINDYGYGNYAEGDTKKEAQENGERLANKYNSENTDKCVDLCWFIPSLCD